MADSNPARRELEEWVERWLKANQDAEAAGDWKALADFYADDATYGWNIGPKEDVMCIGKKEIRDVALGLEMEGLENWVYEYQKVLIDEKQNEIVGFWKQVAHKGDGSRHEIYGIGGSWFRLAPVGDDDRLLIEWQRDFFDFGHVQKAFMKLIESGDLTPAMQKRIERSLAGEKLPGYYPLGEAPTPIW
ncbi:MAG: nuclear transport factor 2 family protein [Mycobacterium sp.]|nr:nuclear transport factor 2 family protein [Mycobacterium sp.]